MTGNIWWIGPLVLVLLRLLYAEARVARASLKGDAIVFRAPFGVRLLLALGIAIFVVLTVKSLGHEETWVIASGIALTIAFCLGWPSTISTDSSGIARRVWWKPTLQIPWSAVLEFQKGPGGDWTVYGSDGKRIVFSRYHSDPQRFEVEVLKRAKFNSSGGPRFVPDS